MVRYAQAHLNVDPQAPGHFTSHVQLSASRLLVHCIWVKTDGSFTEAFKVPLLGDIAKYPYFP